MADRTVSLRAFEGQLRKDTARLKGKVEKAIKYAARESVKGVRARTPKAFGELRDSIHTETGQGAVVAKLVVSAPHASAVEEGSRPHVVPIDELVAWVKLRGMQGLTRGARMRSSNPRARKFDAMHGPTTRSMARLVAGEIKAQERGGAVDIDVPMAIARAIQAKIAKVGTRPHHYVYNSLDAVIVPDLDAQIEYALR